MVMLLMWWGIIGKITITTEDFSNKWADTAENVRDCAHNFPIGQEPFEEIDQSSE